MRTAWLSIASTFAFLVACGDSDVKVTDAPAATADAPYDTSQCLIRGFYGALGPLSGTTSQGPTTSTIVLDAGPPRDSFFLKLNAGMGVFSSGLATGSYPLTGAELGSTTCGACVNIIADIVTGQGPSKFYFATGGTLTLTATQPPAGSLANVTFQEVTVGGAMVPGGCTGRIDSMSFTTM